MIRQFLALVSLCVISTSCAGSDSSEVEDVNAALMAKISEALADAQVVSNEDFRIELMTFDDKEGNHPAAARLGLAGDSVVHVYRNNKQFLSILPEPGDGLYLISLWNPVEEKMISVLEINADTGAPVSISYSGTKEGVYFNTSDLNWDGQADTILFGEKIPGPMRIWLQERWQEIVRKDGENGVVIDGNWKRVERNRETKEYEISESSSGHID